MTREEMKKLQEERAYYSKKVIDKKGEIINVIMCSVYNRLNKEEIEKILNLLSEAKFYSRVLERVEDEILEQKERK